MVHIISDNYEDVLDHIIFGFNIMSKDLVKGKLNWQSYVLTPVTNLLAKSGYKGYTHILGVKLPKLPESISEDVKRRIPWCSTKCNLKYRKRCLEKETETEIDAFVFGSKKKACVIEHATEIGGLCWDMVKVYKFMTSRKGFSSCLFLTWADINNEEHTEITELTMSLGKMLFDELIGKENWSIIYITYEMKEGNVLLNKKFYCARIRTQL